MAADRACHLRTVTHLDAQRNHRRSGRQPLTSADGQAQNQVCARGNRREISAITEDFHD